MLRNKLNNKKKKKGFTLIELIVVLAVLAIIALIAIPNFNQVRENSKINADKRGADLIDKSVTLLVQDGTITDTPKTGDKKEESKAAVYGFNDKGKLEIMDPTIGDITGKFTQKEEDQILATINDGKGPQSYDKKAVWVIKATKLGTKEADVSVDLYDKKVEGATNLYGSDDGNAEAATTSTR